MPRNNAQDPDDYELRKALEGDVQKSNERYESLAQLVREYLVAGADTYVGRQILERIASLV